jgi:hypothetical protein
MATILEISEKLGVTNDRLRSFLNYYRKKHPEFKLHAAKKVLVGRRYASDMTVATTKEIETLWNTIGPGRPK